MGRDLAPIKKFMVPLLGLSQVKTYTVRSRCYVC